MKRYSQWCVAIALSLTSLVYASAPALSYTLVLDGVKQAPPPPPPDRGAPGDRLRGGAVWYNPPEPPERGMPDGRTRGGASRGNCPPTAHPLTALAPTVPVNPTSNTNPVWGLTTAERPTFWFYVPYEITSDVLVEFVLLDEEDNIIYQTNLTVTDSAGIISVTPASTAPELEVDKLYRWFFLIYCSDENPVFTQGAIQRATPNAELAATLQRSPIHEQAALYASNGFWYDAVTTLATLRRAEPTNSAIATDWSSLLQSAGLEDIAQQPLIDCCIP